MSRDRSRRRPAVAAAAALLLVFAAVWIVLDRTERRPRWLVVDGPARAAVGSRIEYRVMLKKAGPGDLVDCTLHYADAERREWGYLASSGPPQPAVAGRTYTFVFTVPEHPGSEFAFALVYLSPTGRWAEGTRAASTVSVPLVRGGAPDQGPALRRTRVHRYPTASESARAASRPPRPRGRPSVWIHPIVGALLAAAAAGSAMAARRSGGGAVTEFAGERALWLSFAAVLAGAAVVELSGIAGHIAALGRRLAEERGVYELRKPVQEAVTAATASVSLGLFFLFLRAVRRPGSHRCLWWAGIGLAAYLAVSFVKVLSFHAVDAAGSVVWHGVSPVDAIRGGGAAVAAAWLAVRARRRDPAT